MKITTIFHVADMNAAVSFYTKILDFTLKYPDTADDWVVDLINGDAELQLTKGAGDQKAAINANVSVDDVDSLFAKYRQRGLDPSNKKESPVHQGPIDQSWGMREFYVTDPDGNTLRFRKPL